MVSAVENTITDYNAWIPAFAGHDTPTGFGAAGPAVAGRTDRRGPQPAGRATRDPSNQADQRPSAKRVAGAKVRLGCRRGAPACRRTAPRRCVLPACVSGDAGSLPRRLVASLDPRLRRPRHANRLRRGRPGCRREDEGKSSLTPPGSSLTPLATQPLRLIITVFMKASPMLSDVASPRSATAMCTIRRS